MFIRQTHLARMFKKAYKGVGLRIIRDKDGIGLTGRSWYMYVFWDCLPKEILGLIISLVGILPEDGEQQLSNTFGNQMELYKTDKRQDIYKAAMDAQASGNMIYSTGMILANGLDEMFRVYKGKENNHYLVPEGCRLMCNTSACREDEEMYGCFADPEGWIYWIGSDMAFGIAPGEDEELKPWLEKIKNAGIL